MWTAMTTFESTRRFGSAGLGAALVAAAGLAMAGPASAQQQYDEHYEWEPDEGVHKEEWYDPSDWFDDWFDERRVDFESDWYEDDEYEDYSENYYDYGYGNQSYGDEYDAYRVYYYSDLYDDQQRQQQGQQTQDRQQDHRVADQQRQPQQRQSQQRQSQQRQQSEQQRQTQQQAELRGQIEDWRRVSLQGDRDQHTLVKLRLQDGTSKVVDLGPNVELSRLDLQRGDQVAVHGMKGMINGRDVLMAQRVRVGQDTIAMNNWDPQQHHQVRQRQPDQQRRQAQQGASQVQQGQRQDRRQEQRQRQDRRTAMHTGQQGMQNMHRDARMVQQMISDWPEASRKAAQSMLGKYGRPDGVTPEMLVWRNTGPFVKTIVHANAVEHNFPTSHEDVLEQAVNMEVPADKMDELARFDGSIIVYRTDGLMSARCHKEAMNVLALNLAADIINNEKSVEEARQRYVEAASAYAQGDRPEITQQLQFQSPSRNIDRPNAPGQPARQMSRSSQQGQGSGQNQGQNQGHEVERKQR